MGDPLLLELLYNSHDFLNSLFLEVHCPLLWPNQIPSIAPLTEPLTPILSIGPTFGTNVARLEVKVYKVKLVSILDAGLPVNLN